MPTHKGSHVSDCLSIAGLLREFLICRLIPGEFSVWGTVPVVSFQQGTGHTVLVILTFRPTGALDNSTTGQGLIYTEVSITGTEGQYIRDCTGSLNRLGGCPGTGSLNRLGGRLHLISPVYLFIWDFTSLSTLYRSYHDG